MFQRFSHNWCSWIAINWWIIEKHPIRIHQPSPSFNTNFLRSPVVCIDSIWTNINSTNERSECIRYYTNEVKSIAKQWRCSWRRCPFNLLLLVVLSMQRIEIVIVVLLNKHYIRKCLTVGMRNAKSVWKFALFSNLSLISLFLPLIHIHPSSWMK